MLLKCVVLYKRIRVRFREPVVVQEVPDELLDESVLSARESFRPFLTDFIKKHVRTRQGAFRRYKLVFRGDELASYLIAQRVCADRQEAAEFGQLLFLARLFHHTKVSKVAGPLAFNGFLPCSPL